MLTPERHQLILQLLKEKDTVKIHELVRLTNSSESTIRRDLNDLEDRDFLKRVHGGAAAKQVINQELSFPEKTTKNLHKKRRVAAYGADLIQKGEYIFLDAGTTTFEMIPFLKDKQVTIVTNGLTHLEALSEYKIETYLTGGFVKYKTKALIGHGAQSGMEKYRFDKCFLGVNGIHPFFGFTTPDPEEALVKKRAIQLAQQSFILADDSKLDQLSFAKIADLDQAMIIMNKTSEKSLTFYQNKTNIKVV